MSKTRMSPAAKSVVRKRHPRSSGECDRVVRDLGLSGVVERDVEAAEVVQDVVESPRPLHHHEGSLGHRNRSDGDPHRVHPRGRAGEEGKVVVEPGRAPGSAGAKEEVVHAAGGLPPDRLHDPAEARTVGDLPERRHVDHRLPELSEITGKFAAPAGSGGDAVPGGGAELPDLVKPLEDRVTSGHDLALVEDPPEERAAVGGEPFAEPLRGGEQPRHVDELADLVRRDGTPEGAAVAGLGAHFTSSTFSDPARPPELRRPGMANGAGRRPPGHGMYCGASPGAGV